jgi:hypothetical protein
MLRDHRQLRIPPRQLSRGLAETDVPGEPIAYLHAAPGALERRLHVQFQDSFDNLDSLRIALLELPTDQRVALIHHCGLPEDVTELYVDGHEWRQRDMLDDVLRSLGIAKDEVSWRQEWPTSLTG